MFVLFAFWSSCDSLCLVFVAFKPMTLFYLHLGPSVVCCVCFYFVFSLQLGPILCFYCTGVLPLYFCVCVISFWLCRSVPIFSLFADWSFLLFFRGLGFFLALHFSPRFCFNHIQVLCTSTVAHVCYLFGLAVWSRGFCYLHLDPSELQNAPRFSVFSCS